MGKSDNARFTSTECRSILDSIQNELDFRLKESNSLSKIQEDVIDLISKRNSLAKQKEFNINYCILCRIPFNLLFKRKILCFDCCFYICKQCSSWDVALKQWLCKVCEKQRILDAESRIWICNRLKSSFGHFRAAKVLQGFCRNRRISDSENDSGYGPTSDVGPLLKLLSSHSLNNDLKMADASYDGEEEEDLGDEEELAEIHHSIETILEGLLGGSFDDATVDQLYPGVSLYEKLFASFHGQLVEAIQNLSKALQKALHNLPSENGITPTTAHAALKRVISSLVEECQDFPCLQVSDQTETESLNTNCSFEYCDIFSSYDSLVASAVINKVVEECQSRFIKDQFATLEADGADIHKYDNDDFTEAQIGDIELKNNCTSDITVETLTPADVSAFGMPIESVKIEEEVEEITQEFTDSEEDKLSSVSHWSSSFHSMDDGLQKVSELDSFSKSLSGVNDNRTSFPEFGYDLVEDIENEDLDVTCHPTVTLSWEENWLFRKKKRLPLYSNLKYQLLTYCDEPPCMLIPCPSDSTDVADTQDDLSSELSEPHSVGSLESSSDTEEMNTETIVLNEPTVVSIKIASKSPVLRTPSPVPLPKTLPVVPQPILCHSKDSFETQRNQLDIKLEVLEKENVCKSPVNTNVVESPPNLENNSVGTPPRPGTIAEREHQKWLNAVPLKNNPYSAENISKRSNRPQNPMLKEPASSFEEFERKLSSSSITSEQASQVKLDCGLKSIDEDLYKRDYYINNYVNGSGEIACLLKPPAQFESFDGCYGTLSEEALNSMEEKVYVSSGKVFTLENSIKRLERELKDSSFSSETSTVQPLVSDIPVKINKKNSHSNLKAEGEKVKKSRPCMKVHSLTARSLSREFRDLARLNLPKPMNRTISVQPVQGHEETSERDSLCSPESLPSSCGAVQPDAGHGYTSDESSTSTNSIPRAKARRHISRSILQRASYWERRVEQGLLSDASVNEEFPGVDISP